mmetsp:Transcript_3152/g.7951  ORF Transcript_3152/g.7951 Transcript_3152/m.7951 type:complete len:226 (+) Transcript_3152:85-762(+)
MARPFDDDMADDLKGSKKVDVGLKMPITKGAKKDLKFANKAPDKDKSIAKDKDKGMDKDKDGGKKWKKGKPGKKFLKVDGVVRGKSGRAGLEFPVARVHRYLKKYLPMNGIVSVNAAVYTAAVMEYLVAEIVEVCGQVQGYKKYTTIKPRHLMLGIKSDPELQGLVKATIAGGGVVPNVQGVLFEDSRTRFKAKPAGDGGASGATEVARRVPGSKSSKGMPAGEY